MLRVDDILHGKNDSYTIHGSYWCNENGWVNVNLCLNQGSLYLYNGADWIKLQNEEKQTWLEKINEFMNETVKS